MLRVKQSQRLMVAVVAIFVMLFYPFYLYYIRSGQVAATEMFSNIFGNGVRTTEIHLQTSSSQVPISIRHRQYELAQSSKPHTESKIVSNQLHVLRKFQTFNPVSHKLNDDEGAMKDTETGIDTITIENSQQSSENDSISPRLSHRQQDNRYQVTKSFTLPVPHSTLTVDDVLRQQWMKELQMILSEVEPDTGPVSITTCDYKFREVLLNWLIASTPRLGHIIILSMDQSVYDLLKSHGLNCLYVTPESFLKTSVTSTLKKHVAFSELQILRLTVMRFLNHWGYDAANYDADAIVLKSPEMLYYDTYRPSHLIASYGHYPAEIRAVWGGITLCAGVFMVKSAPATEVFWDAMNAVLPNSYNDQARLNNALLKLDVQWGKSRYKDIITEDWQGTTSNGLNVTVLSARKMCRQTCNRRFKEGYYVWHKGGSGTGGKMRYAEQGGVWFLRKDWEDASGQSTVTGMDWLRYISKR